VGFIQVPTTLLAQVDSSVGGKTAVNHRRGKNMIGAFYQPRCVVADLETLHSLAQRELRAGIAEVIKYGLIRDAEFFRWLEDHLSDLLDRDPEALRYAVLRSCELKAGIVSADETETGQRETLNLGHTFGHAIETGLGYGQWLHGEAVAAGMCMAAHLSAQMAWIDGPTLARIYALIGRAGLPTAAPADLSAKRLSGLMSADKKVRKGQLRLVLLRQLGEATVSSDFAQDLLTATLTQCRTQRRQDREPDRQLAG